MENILDDLYEQPEHYNEVIELLGMEVLDHFTFDKLNDYDYREYLNDEIRDHIVLNGGYCKLRDFAVNVLCLPEDLMPTTIENHK